MSQVIDNLIVENSIDAPLSTQVNNALATKYDTSNPSGFQTAAQVATAANNAVTTANAFTTAQISALVAASPSTLDTLDELAAALGEDPNFAASTTTALGNRLRVDTAAQGLSGTQKTNAKTNLDLQNVNNTSDLSKPISTATQSALNLKYDASNPNNYETPTQLNTRDTNNRNRANHTGEQTASTISDFAATVRSTVLAGFSATNAVVVATDQVLPALGKLQGQITQTIADLASGLATKANNVLTGLNLTDSSDVVATDTVLQGIGKLQAQNNLWIERVVTSQVNNTSNTTLASLTELSFPVVNGKRYRIEAMLIFQSVATNTGLALTMGNTGSTGELALRASMQAGGDGTTAIFSGAITSFGDVVTATASTAANTSLIAKIEGVFVCTTSGTLTPQFRSEVNGNQVSVRIGSNILVREF
ncbi:hypothetical protein EKK58_10470 [Candidatus Dependentiae bacterium]|nr:MAG: hypothetical protein EKK58_10470 [Candidatus Dependentiae bacterium]